MIEKELFLGVFFGVVMMNVFEFGIDVGSFDVTLYFGFLGFVVLFW